MRPFADAPSAWYACGSGKHAAFQVSKWPVDDLYRFLCVVEDQHSPFKGDFYPVQNSRPERVDEYTALRGQSWRYLFICEWPCGSS